jgi:hypothetical protein
VARFANGGDGPRATRIIDSFLLMYSTEGRA